jgi:hypothetical protein
VQHFVMLLFYFLFFFCQEIFIDGCVPTKGYRFTIYIIFKLQVEKCLIGSLPGQRRIEELGRLVFEEQLSEEQIWPASKNSIFWNYLVVHIKVCIKMKSVVSDVSKCHNMQSSRIRHTSSKLWSRYHRIKGFRLLKS